MGYDLHLTRADDWTDSAASPISVEEWSAFAKASLLTETDALDDGTTSPVFLLGDDPAESPALYWTDGRVIVRGANEEHVAMLADLANALGAALVGDDGERY